MKNFIAAVTLCFCIIGCDEPGQTPVSSSGVRKATVKVAVDNEGLTVEQKNVIERLQRDNTPGSIKHLYVISAMSGDVLIYSTVKGKVTSSGKRLTPTVVAVTGDRFNTGEEHEGMYVKISNRTYATSEVLQDDGTYGTSIQYLFWFDSRDIYHQHYVTGGQIIHISDQPLVVPKIILNLENVSSE